MTLKHCLLPLLVILSMIALSTVNTSTTYGTLAKYLPPDILCPGEYDVVVMLDISQKVNEKTFSEFVELIKKLVHLFDIREDGNHFGLVLYNNNPQFPMKLNENNNATVIKDFLMTNLPARQGGRNLQRALRQTRQQLLTQAMGDRPNVTNVCLLLTTEDGNSVRSNKQFPKIKQVCDKFVVLRKGGYRGLEKVVDKVCPTPTDEEAKARIIDFLRGLFPCNDTCNEESNQPECPLPYTKVRDYCFHATIEQTSFFGNVAACGLKNGTLVTVDTAEKNAALVQYFDALDLQSTTSGFFIGLFDQSGDNSGYIWISDNSPLTYNNWAPGEPDTAAETCVVAFGPVLPPGTTRGLWLDFECSLTFGAICETDPV